MKATGLLWKFYKGDPNDCHYLFGTMHLATDAAYTYAELEKSTSKSHPCMLRKWT